jgi:RNA polymerase sigma-70 factor (ECF subfamily)
MQDELLLRIARRELARRGPRLAITGPELDDLAYQAAADALLAITGKVRQFRGESRFTTWAYKCVMLEVSAKIGRHFWRHPSVPLGTEQWEQLPARFGFDPAREAEWRDLAAAVRRAVDTELTPPPAGGLRGDRGQRRPPGRPGRVAGIQPRRHLQSDVRRPA